MPDALRYRRTDLILDYGRAALGFGLAGGAVMAAPTSTPVLAIAGGLAALFGAFGLRTALRQMTRYWVSDEGIVAAALGTTVIAWDDLDRLALRYYAGRRKRPTAGWMTLTIAADGRRLTLDSTLPDFERIVALALAAARRNRIQLNEITLDNLAAMGLPPDWQIEAEAPPA